MSSITPLRVLIVDDEPDLCSIIKDVFEEAGFETTTAENLDLAFKALKNEKISVVVSDFLIPPRNVDPLISFIYEQKKDIAVILLTGYDQLNLNKILLNGVDALFGKPFENECLIKTARRLIEFKKEMGSRRSIRVPLSTGVRIETEDGTKILGKTLNASVGGLCVSLDKTLKEGDLVSIKILEETDLHFPIEGAAVVRWHLSDEKTNKIGLQFESFTGTMGERYYDFLNTLITKH